MVLTRSGHATKPIEVKKRISRKSEKKERPSSFEADFEAILNDSEDDIENVFSSDSGTISDLTDPFNTLNTGHILQRSGSFQLNRRHRHHTEDEADLSSSFESSRELFCANSTVKPTPNFCPSTPAPQSRIKGDDRTFSPITPRANRVFDTPGTPRSLVRRLSQTSSSSPRWQRKGAKRARGENKPANSCIVNPFSPAPNNKSQQAINVLNKSMCRTLIHNTSSQRYKKEFVEIGPLGTGTFGEVMKVRNRYDGIIYAIKKTRNPLKGSREEIQAVREVCAHAVLGKHENVVQYFSAWSEEDRMLIQFEYCNGRSLADDLVDRVKRNRGGMNTDDIVLLLQHCGRGLSYIHSQQLAHMDIKPGNIFRCLAPHDNSLTYKIGDLGLVCPSNERIYDEGDCRYVAMELIEQIDKNTNLCSADVFSLGISLYEAATLISPPKNGQCGPWHELRSSQLIKADLDAKSSLNQKLKLIIVRMTNSDPKSRPLLTNDLLNGLTSTNVSVQVRDDENARLVEELHRRIRVLEEGKRKDENTRKLKLRLSTA